MGAEEGDSDEEFTADAATSMVPSSALPSTAQAKSGELLRPHKLDIRGRRPIEMAPLAEGKKAAVVQRLQFHPNSELLLTAGLDKTLRIFSVDGAENPKVASYFFKRYPIMG